MNQIIIGSVAVALVAFLHMGNAAARYTVSASKHERDREGAGTFKLPFVSRKRVETQEALINRQKVRGFACMYQIIDSSHP